MRIIHRAAIAGLAILTQHQGISGILVRKGHAAVYRAARSAGQLHRHQRRSGKAARSAGSVHINQCSRTLRHKIQSIRLDAAAEHQRTVVSNHGIERKVADTFQRVAAGERGRNTATRGLDIHPVHGAAGANHTTAPQHDDTIPRVQQAFRIRPHRQRTSGHVDFGQFAPRRILDCLHISHTGSGQQVCIMMDLTTTGRSTITTQHQGTGSRCMRYRSPGIHRSAAIDNLHPFERILGKTARATVAVHIHTGSGHGIQITLGLNITADAQRAAIADGLTQRQFHPGINNQAADAAGNQLARAMSIGMLQCQAASVQHHAASVAVIATQGHRAVRHHAGATAQRCSNLACLRQQHTATHGAAKLHITSHRHRARRCRKCIGRRIHQQGAAGHLNRRERTICGHILQYLAYRYSVTARHHIFCEIRGSTSRSKTILTQNQSEPGGQSAMYQLRICCQHLAAIHHLQGIPLCTGKSAITGISIHIDLRGIQLRQLPDAAHIHLTTQRQGAIHRIGDDPAQLQRTVILHHDAAHPRRGQHTRKILRFDFQTGIIQAHHSAAQRRGRARYHLAAQNLRTACVIIFGVDD